MNKEMEFNNRGHGPGQKILMRQQEGQRSETKKNLKAFNERNQFDDTTLYVFQFQNC